MRVEQVAYLTDGRTFEYSYAIIYPKPLSLKQSLLQKL